MKKVDKNAWFEQGLKVLESEGFQRLTIDNLCALLRITKGSFYHHFNNIDGYTECLMNYWRDMNTLDFISATETLDNVNEKYARLHELAASASQKVEQMVRAWGFTNETVRKYLQQVDDMRVEYLIKLNRQAGYKKKEARYRAILEYGTLIGIQQLNPDISKEEFQDLYLLFNHQMGITKK